MVHTAPICRRGSQGDEGPCTRHLGSERAGHTERMMDVQSLSTLVHTSFEGEGNALSKWESEFLENLGEACADKGASSSKCHEKRLRESLVLSSKLENIRKKQEKRDWCE